MVIGQMRLTVPVGEVSRHRSAQCSRFPSSALANLIIAAMLSLSDETLLDAVRRHSLRAAAAVHQDLHRGLNSLATIAATAPFLGILGTVPSIVGSFVGCGGEKWTCLAAVVLNLSNAIVPTALGLLVAIPALWCYKHLSSRVEAFDLEMDGASLDLVNRLAVHLRRPPTARPT
jgi:biopolymer transport protein ExbB/TolQ